MSVKSPTGSRAELPTKRSSHRGVDFTTTVYRPLLPIHANAGRKSKISCTW